MRIFEQADLTVDLYNTDTSQEIVLKGSAYCIWPNREGEGFRIEEVYPVLKREDAFETGLSLSYPATASSTSIAFYPGAEDSSGTGKIFHLKEDDPGNHTSLTIHAASEKEISFCFTGNPKQWEIKDLTENPGRGRKPVSRQFQVGLIGPDKGCSIPESTGFHILESLAEDIKKAFPGEKEKTVLHIFGYAQGHDIGYPDYTPSPQLGGAERLAEALTAIKRMGYESSLYMNARIIDQKELANYPDLKNSLCRNDNGEILEEEYFDRRFYVMNPNSSAWQNCLYEKACRLKDLGADWIQLDQVAGRAALLPPGEAWGQGYFTLIKKLQKAGLKIWIQGVSDYYPANAFEMTWKALKILPGGVIRGGLPFGKPDLKLLETLPEHIELILPYAKRKSMKSEGFNCRFSMMGDYGQLPLYNANYIQELKKKSSSISEGKLLDS